MTLSISLVYSQTAAQVKPESAKTIIEKAQSEAAKTNRNVFVTFSASWCGWCHKMASVLKQDDVRVIMDRYFVIASLITLENGDKKSLENAGSSEYLKNAGGENQGIPFYYITDSNGKMVINSMAPGEKGKNSNVGCPYEPAEIAYFIKMIRKGAPKISESELKHLQSAFEALKRRDGN